MHPISPPPTGTVLPGKVGSKGGREEGRVGRLHEESRNQSSQMPTRAGSVAGHTGMGRVNSHKNKAGGR